MSSEVAPCTSRLKMSSLNRSLEGYQGGYQCDQMLTKIYPKRRHVSFYLKIDVFKIAQNVNADLGYINTKNCHQGLS